MGKVTTGLVAIEFAPLAADGGPGTAFAKLGYTARDSAKLSQADPTKDDFFAEELVAAVESNYTPGEITLNWNVMAVDADDLKTIFGGDVTAGPPKKWTAPDLFNVLEGTIRITPQKGMITQLNRVTLTPTFDYELSKKGQLLIKLSGTVLQPTKAGVKLMTITNPA